MTTTLKESKHFNPAPLQTEASSSATITQAAVALVATLQQDMAAQTRRSGRQFDPKAAITFAASVLNILRRGEWSQACELPDDFGIAPCFDTIKQWMDTHPALVQAVKRYPLWTKSVVNLLSKDHMDKLHQPSAINPLFRAIYEKPVDEGQAIQPALAEQGADQSDEHGNRAIHH